MKRKDEELCKSRFNNYLLTLFERGEINWIEVEQKDEPPDFYLELAGIKHAVEVTSVIEKTRTRAGNEIPYFSTLFPLKELVDRVGIRAKQSGFLNGGYLVVFREPFEDFDTIKAKLEKDLLEYIKETTDENAFQERVIYEKRDQICTITKGHNRVDEVRMFWNRGAINVDGLEADICRLVKERLNEKAHRLRNIDFPRIILLYDLYGFGEYTLSNPDIRTRCTESLANPLKPFRAVFVVRDDSNGFIFSPEKAQWNRMLFTSNRA